MLKAGKIFLVLAWMLFIISLSSIPSESFGFATLEIESILAHIFLYIILAYLIYSAVRVWPTHDLIPAFYTGMAIVIFCFLFGIFDEYFQGFTPGRFVSFSDLVFDALGAVGGVLFYLKKSPGKPKLLLHVCCAGCGAYVSRLLKKDFDVVLYYYNSNIYPESEYNKRLSEAKRIARLNNLKIISSGYRHDDWLKKISGHEEEPERGKRCYICYQDRLKNTAKFAKSNGFNFFTTTLTISPHKEASMINKIGLDLERQYGVNFLNKDFKKQDGFKEASELSKKLNLYRQNYCGCEFSRKSIN